MLILLCIFNGIIMYITIIIIVASSINRLIIFLLRYA